MSNLKVMTFNTQHCLNYLEQKIDFDIMAKAILDCDADIVGLNEMRDEGQHEEYTAQVKKLSELTGIKNYYFAKAIDFGGANPYGNGLLSKLPILSAETIGIPDPEPRAYKGYYETRCILKAKLEGGITVLAVHFGLNPDEQKNAVDTILAHLADEKCILMGDFNIQPDNELLAPIKAKMTDTADYFDEPKLSFPSDEPNVKIDYLFVTPDIEVVKADIPAIVAADHRPHIAEIKL